MSQEVSRFDLTKILNSREVGIFLYYATIMSIGLFIVRSYVDFPVVDYNGLVALLAYLALIILLEPPKPADLHSEPFQTNKIIEK